MTEAWDPEETQEHVPVRRPTYPKAAGLITVFDGTRPVHHVAITDGLDATLEANGAVYTCSISRRPNRSPWHHWTGDVEIGRGGHPVVLRVGELVALGFKDVITKRPPRVLPGGLVCDHETARLIEAWDDADGPFLIEARAGAGRGAIVRALHARLRPGTPFVAVDGREYADNTNATRQSFSEAALHADRGTFYVSHVEATHEVFRTRLLSAIERRSPLPNNPNIDAWITCSADPASHEIVGERFRLFWQRLSVPALVNRVTIVPHLLQQTLARLPGAPMLTAPFVAKITHRAVLEKLEVADVVRLTELAAIRARASDHTRLTAAHLERWLA